MCSRRASGSVKSTYPPFVRDVGKAVHLEPQGRRGAQVVAGDDFGEGVVFQVADAEIPEQFGGRVPFSQVALKSPPAVRAQAVQPVKVVDDDSVHTQTDRAAEPGFEHRAPVGIRQAAIVDLVRGGVIVGGNDGRAIGVLLEQVQRIADGFGAQFLFVPEVAVEPEETAL